ncbi:hypothetical protein VSR34_33675 [Paraburkholderia sp. JHI2823]
MDYQNGVPPTSTPIASRIRRKPEGSHATGFGLRKGKPGFRLPA